MLAAGPHAQRRRVLLPAPVGHGARGADGGVQLVRPHVGSLQHVAGAGQRLVHVALVNHLARGGRVVAQRLGHVAQRRHAGPGLPAHDQLGSGLLGLFFALGHHTDEVADDHHGANAWNVRNRALIHRFERVANELAVVGPGIGRAHHATMQHAGQAHVVHKHRFAKGLGRNVHPRRALTHHAVLGHGLDGHVGIQVQHHAPAVQQLTIVHAARRIAAHADTAGIDAQLVGRHLQALRRLGQQPGARLRSGLAQRYGADLDGGAGDGGALVGCAAGVAQHHVHLLHGQVQLLGHDLAQRRANAGAQIDVAVQPQRGAVVPHGQQNFGPLMRVAGDERGLARRGRRRWRRLARDQQHALRAQEVAAGAQLGQTLAAVHGALPSSRAMSAMSSVARSTAANISTCVPQRHRLPDKASRTACTLGCGSRASRAAVVMIMPFRQ